MQDGLTVFGGADMHLRVAGSPVDTCMDSVHASALSCLKPADTVGGWLDHGLSMFKFEG